MFDGPSRSPCLCETVGVCHVACNRVRPEIEILSVNNNRVGDAGVVALMDALVAGALPRLRQLGLQGNPRIGDGGLDAVARALPHLACLRTLKLVSSGASADARTRLRSAAQACSASMSLLL